MKKLNGILWGLVLIVIGLIIAGNSLNIINVDLFFNGWWTLFIIVPCFIGLITDRDKMGSLIGLLVGILLLLACQDIIGFDMFWKLIFPIIIIICGISLIIRTIFNRKLSDDIEQLNKKISKDGTISAIFSGQKVSFAGQDFKGTNLSAVFGSIELDLRDAKIKEDVVINASAVFGGIEIFVDEDIDVVIKSSSVFGGADNSKKDTKKEKKHKIYVDAACVFGGLDVK